MAKDVLSDGSLRMRGFHLQSVLKDAERAGNKADDVRYCLFCQKGQKTKEFCLCLSYSAYKASELPSNCLGEGIGCHLGMTEGHGVENGGWCSVGQTDGKKENTSKADKSVA